MSPSRTERPALVLAQQHERPTERLSTHLESLGQADPDRLWGASQPVTGRGALALRVATSESDSRASLRASPRYRLVSTRLGALSRPVSPVSLSRPGTSQPYPTLATPPGCAGGRPTPPLKAGGCRPRRVLQVLEELQGAHQPLLERRLGALNFRHS